MAGSSYRVLDNKAPDRASDPHVSQLADNIQKGIQALTPVRTGHLKAGWYKTKEKDAHYRLHNDVPYAKFVEYGTVNMPAQPSIGRVVANTKARYS